MAPDAPAPTEDPRPAGLTVELGNKGLHRDAVVGSEETLPALRGLRAAKVYAEMVENDAIVGAVLFAIEMLLRRVEWAVEPGTDDQDGQDAAQLVSECMADMSHSWADFIVDALTMLPQGYAALEVVYKLRVGPKETDPTRRSRYSDGKLGWRKMVLLPQTTIPKFELDDHGGIRGLWQTIKGEKQVFIPIDKLLLFQTSRRRPEGKSVLRSAIRSWQFKKRVEEIEGIGIERDLAGLPVLYLPPEILSNPDRRQEYQDIIRNLRRDEQEGVLLPQVFDELGNQLVKLELLSSGGARQFDVNGVIGRYARYIAMSLLQDVIMLGHERVGTQSLAAEKRDLSDTALAAWLQTIAGVVNDHAVPKLLAYNGFDLENPPKVVPGDLRQTDILELSEAVKNLAEAQFTLAGDPDVEDFVRRRVGLPLMGEDDRQLLAMNAQVRAQADLAAGQQQTGETASGGSGGGTVGGTAAGGTPAVSGKPTSAAGSSKPAVKKPPASGTTSAK